MSTRNDKHPHLRKHVPHPPHPPLSRERSEHAPTPKTRPERPAHPDALLQSMADELGWADPAQAAVALRVVLEALREHLARRTARLTHDLAGLIGGTRTRAHHRSAAALAQDQARFLARVSAALPGRATPAETRRVVAAAIDVFERQCPHCHCSDFGLSKSCRCRHRTATV